MAPSTLYDEDILLWSEQQAEAIRTLGRSRRDLPNELDLDNVAEEIESVGRSELAAVSSLIRQVLLHLIKLAVNEDAHAVRHWRGEIIAFHDEIRRRYAPSMRQRIEVEELWRSALEQLRLSGEPEQQRSLLGLPEQCPLDLRDVLARSIDSDALVGLLRGAIVSDRSA